MTSMRLPYTVTSDSQWPHLGLSPELRTPNAELRSLAGRIMGSAIPSLPALEMPYTLEGGDEDPVQ